MKNRNLEEKTGIIRAGVKISDAIPILGVINFYRRKWKDNDKFIKKVNSENKDELERTKLFLHRQLTDLPSDLYLTGLIVYNTIATSALVFVGYELINYISR